MAGRGGAIPGNGRKKKADEQRIRDLTSPYVSGAIECVVAIMQNGERESDRLAAAKLLLAYHFGQPSQAVDLTSKGESIRPTFKVATSNDAEAITKLYDNSEND